MVGGLPMRSFALVALAAAVVSPVFAQEQQDCKKACGKCGQEKFGTSISWKGTPTEAAALAKKEEKLLFILHVSGNFEDPKFT
jgi:hypothetical protein